MSLDVPGRHAAHEHAVAAYHRAHAVHEAATTAKARRATWHAFVTARCAVEAVAPYDPEPRISWGAAEVRTATRWPHAGSTWWGGWAAPGERPVSSCARISLCAETGRHCWSYWGRGADHTSDDAATLEEAQRACGEAAERCRAQDWRERVAGALAEISTRGP